MNLKRSFRENLSVRLFVIFSLSMIIVSAIATTLFVIYQKKTFLRTSIEEGQDLAELFAKSVRLGIFTENDEILHDPANGILRHKGVRKIAVYTSDGRNLLSRQSFDSKSTKADLSKSMILSIIERLKEKQSAFYMENSDGKYSFFAPSFSSGNSKNEYELFFDTNGAQPGGTFIGFTEVEYDTSFPGQNRLILYNGILLGVTIFLGGILILYTIINRIVKPLKKLTASVDALGKGGSVDLVPVNTSDEIGRLAKAFNEMTTALRNNEAERKAMENQLRQTQKLESIGTLTGGVAHEFNNIMTGIQGHAQLLLNELPENDKLDYRIYQILSCANRASAITRSLLSFSRSQSMVMKPTNIRTVISNISPLLRIMIEEDINIRILNAEEDFFVMGDSAHIEMVILNLAANARDAMPDGGILTVNVKERDDFVAIYIADTGVGMDNDTKEKAFDPFFTTKAVGKGTGLGLSIVYGIIQQHGGRIELRSTVGRGTTVIVFLPALRDKIEIIRAETSKSQIEGGKETILYIEDDDIVRDVTQDVVKSHGYSVIEARDGEDALTQFKANSEKINLVLCDVVMPRKNGKEVSDMIKRMKPDVKIIFMSGYAADIMENKGETGIPFLTKPASTEDLLNKIREVLDKK